VHGYSSDEARRLADQADTLADLLHHDTVFAPGRRVLEIGCGVGAQTVHVLARNPGIRLTAVERSRTSLEQARATVTARHPNADVTWLEADLFDLPFANASFDDVLVCFVLEHLERPAGALHALRRLITPGGTLTVIEGDHGTAVYHPASAAAQRTIDCLVELQARAGGDALIGRALYPLVSDAGYAEVSVSARTVYADDGRPAVVEGFTRNTFNAMVESVGPDAVSAGLISADDWSIGLAELRRTAEPGGTFHYTFFKAQAAVPH
jgi:SAM-dependent methyltransferase